MADDLLKAKKVSNSVIEYRDKESNDPLFTETKSPGPSRWDGDRFHTEIHPAFKEMHDLHTPYTHLSLYPSANRTSREDMSGMYSSILSGANHPILNPLVTLKHVGMETKSGEGGYVKKNTYRKYAAIDPSGETMGHIHIRHYGEGEGRDEYGRPSSDINNKILSPDTMVSYVSNDPKYMKKHKISQELIDNIRSRNGKETGVNTIQNRLKDFADIHAYKDKPPSFIGGHTIKKDSYGSPTMKVYKTSLKPKEAISRFINHLKTTDIDLANSEPVMRGNSMATITDGHRHHIIEHDPEAGTIVHTSHPVRARSDSMGNEHHEIFENKFIPFDDLRKQLNEVAALDHMTPEDMKHIQKTGDRVLNKLPIAPETRMVGVQIGKPTKSGHIVTFHFPSGDSKNKDVHRVLTAHKPGNSHADITVTLEPGAEHKSTYAVGGLVGHPDRSIKAHEVYAHFLKHAPGNVIMTSDTQSPGGHKVWQKLAKTSGVNVHAFDPDTEEVINSHPALDPEFDHEIYADATDKNSRPGGSDYPAYRALLVAHKK